MNYKSTQRSITVHGIKVFIPANGVIKHLYDQTASAATADAMRDVDTQAAYQCPTGKTFHIIGVYLHHDETIVAGTVVLSSGDTEDAETSTIVSITTIPKANGVIEAYFENKTLLAGKFLTINPTAATEEFIEIIGYEV